MRAAVLVITASLGVAVGAVLSKAGFGACVLVVGIWLMAPLGCTFLFPKYRFSASLVFNAAVLLGMLWVSDYPFGWRHWRELAVAFGIAIAPAVIVYPFKGIAIYNDLLKDVRPKSAWRVRRRRSSD